MNIYRATPIRSTFNFALNTSLLHSCATNLGMGGDTSKDAADAAAERQRIEDDEPDEW